MKLPEMTPIQAMRRGMKAIVGTLPIYKYSTEKKSQIGELVHIYDPFKEEGSKFYTFPKWFKK